MPTEVTCLPCGRPWGAGDRCERCGSRSRWVEIEDQKPRQPIGPIDRLAYRAVVGRPPKWAKALKALIAAE